MKAATDEKQQKIRRIAFDNLQVFDMRTRQPMGRILDMSAKGMKLKSPGPIALHRIYYCNLPLIQEIKDCREIYFDAECRWCKKSEDTGAYNAGFVLRYASTKDAEIARELIRSWMVRQANSLNHHR